MPAVSSTAAEQERAQEELRALLAANQMLPLEPKDFDVRNLSTAIALSGEDDVGHFRERTFRVPAVSFRVGARLTMLQQALTDFQRPNITADELTAYGDLVEETLTLMYQQMRPVTRWDRLTWRLRSNPLLDANATEIGQLFDFFYLCQMRSRFRHNAWSGVLPPRELSTTSTT